MAQFPAMPFWFDAYYGDTEHLTFEEHGIYLKLLRLLWHAPAQRIPNDQDWIGRRFKDHTPKALALIAEFCQCDGNWITQDRLRREFQYVAEKHEKQSARAKSRWDKEKDLSHGNAGAMPPTPTPTPTKKERKKVPAADAADSQLFDLNQKGETEEAEPVDESPRARLFRKGKTMLVQLGLSEKRSGSVIGGWLKTNPDEVGLLALIQYAYDQVPAEPVSYITALLKSGGQGNGNGHKRRRQTLVDIGRELAEEARRAERAAGLGGAPDPERGH